MDDRDSLMRFLIDNADILTGYSISAFNIYKMAKEYLKTSVKAFWETYSDGINATSDYTPRWDEDDIGAINRNLLYAVFYAFDMKFDSSGKLQNPTTSRLNLPEEIRDWLIPSVKQLSKYDRIIKGDEPVISNGKATEIRRHDLMIIMWAGYYFSFELGKEDKESQYGTFCAAMNAVLYDSGMALLYSRSRFDAMLLLSVAESDPIMFINDLIKFTKI
jgi:hypothetical protein